MILREQNGKKVYSDGNEVEQKMYEIAKEYPEDLSQDFIAKNYDYTTNNTFSSVRQNILNWYPFKENATVLEVGAGMGSITGLLCDKCQHVTAVEMNEVRADIIRTRYANRENLEVITDNINDFKDVKKYDYIVFIGVLEYAGIFSDSQQAHIDFLKSIERLLKEDGTLLFAIENRFGVRYWAGAAEDHIQQPFVGVEGYKQAGTAKTFSKFELQEILTSSGFNAHRFYYILPDYKFPNIIFTDEWQPSYVDLEKIPFTYGKNSMMLFNEKDIYKDLLENNVIDFFANSYLIEASKKEISSYFKTFVSARGECKKEYRISTSIDSNNKVMKQAVHVQALPHLKCIFDNEQYLKTKGLNLIDTEWVDNKIVSSVKEYVRADKIFEELLEKNNITGILNLIKQLKEALLKSSEIIEVNESILVKSKLSKDEEDYGPILEKGFIDMTFYNAFYVEDMLIFFDQEWCFDNVPLYFIIYYAVKTVYNRSKVITKISLEEILNKIGIGQERRTFDQLEEYIWSTVLYRQGDLYGEGGYCCQYNSEMSAKYKLNQVQFLEEKIEKQNQDLLNKEGHIALLLESERKLQYENNEVNKTVYLLKLEEANSKESITLLEKKIENIREEVKTLQLEVDNKKGHIEQLLERERELNRIYQSRSWRYMNHAWKIKDAIIPINSKRRLAAKVTVKCIKTPMHVLRKLSPDRMKKFFYYLRKEGVGGVSKRLDDCLIGIEVQSQVITVEEVSMAVEKGKEEYIPIDVPTWDNPLVSIIIPVYNQFEYTYNCIKSIVQNSGDISYEIIIGNDCSTDLTKEVNDMIRGIKVVNNKENLRFLLNCNQAAKSAVGKYVLFLNNDTQVQANWLEPLVQLIERDETIGMVGSKLVYPDGRLQEAGGIFWKDGSAWNYGNRSNPADPEYNYVKEVDYISGAAIMLPRILWEQIGGFDEAFVPAYCEDSDLAFTVRKMGYKVMYQPLSTVVHFEGVSNGTDTNVGQKAYQVVNQEKLYIKWKDVLEKEHFDNAQNVFWARDRSRRKETIVVIDHYVPHYDKDAGSRTVFQYLQLLVKMGYNVKFIGDNFYKHEPYSTEIEQLGVEILYGPYYANNWKKWFKENKDYIDHVFLNRPHISQKYISFLKEFKSINIVYYVCDLHFLREQREYEVTKERKLLDSSKKWYEIEYDIMSQANTVLTISEDEKQIINDMLKQEKAVVFPVFMYEEIKEVKGQFDSRRDMMFVGGFAHTPNKDAVKWFINDLYPRIVDEIPEIKFRIVGSNPPDEILNLQSENIVVEGFVSDERLLEIYKECRLCVIPLRYGAGVKGKTVEAMYNGIPIISTSIGIEGLPGINRCIEAKNTADDFINEVIRLYTNVEKLPEISVTYTGYVRDRFSIEAAKEIMKQVF